MTDEDSNINDSSEQPLKRDEQKDVKDLKIITAISLGHDRNKEIAKFLDTDKSFAAKKVKELEARGLVFKEGIGREVRYKVNPPRVFEFMQKKIIITWGRRSQPSKVAGKSETPISDALADSVKDDKNEVNENE